MADPAKEQMVLNFKADDVRLFARLRQSAIRNRRTLTNEILCRLDRSYNNTQEV